MSRAQKLLSTLVSEQIFFPWIGANYASRQLLVVGESHYNWCDLCMSEGRILGHDTTCYCIAEHLMHLTMPCADVFTHWKKIENAIIGGQATNPERAGFWQSVAYYNYLPASVGDGARVRVDKSLWVRAQPVFRPLLEVLQPSQLVVIGRRTWTRLPEEDEYMDSVKNDGRKIDRCRYYLNSGLSVQAFGLPHPSAGLGAPWHDGLQKLL